jgi:hypothetical protein
MAKGQQRRASAEAGSAQATSKHAHIARIHSDTNNIFDSPSSSAHTTSMVWVRAATPTPADRASVHTCTHNATFAVLLGAGQGLGKPARWHLENQRIEG